MNTLLQNERFHFFIILVVGCLRLINLDFADLQPWDEGLYAVRAEAVVKFNDWLDQTPHSIDGLYSSTHPPLYVWLTALAYTLFGVNEFSARLFSSLFGIGTLLLVYLLGKKIYNAHVGFLAALFLGLNPFFTFWTRQGQFDSALTFFITAAFYCYLSSAYSEDTQPPKTNHLPLIGCGLLLGCGLMTKLFVALGVPFSLLLAAIVFDRRRFKLHLKNLAYIAVIALVVASPWHLWMTMKYGSGDAFFFLNKAAVVQRTLYGVEGNVKELEIFYYVNQLVIFFPYIIIFFCYGLWKALQSRTRERSDTTQRNFSERILSFWFVVFFVVFTIIRTKLSVYLLPMLIPLSLVGANAIHSMRRDHFSKRATLVFSLLTTMVIIWAAYHPWRLAAKEFFKDILHFTLKFSEPLIYFSAIIVLSLLVVYFFLRTDKTRVAFLSASPFLIILPLFLIFAYNIFILDKIQYDDGGERAAAFLKEQDYRHLIAVGNNPNPQLTFYLDGADIGWQKDKTVERLEPKIGINNVKSYLAEQQGTDIYVIVEKDEIALGSFASEEEIVPASYRKVFETKGYSVFQLER
jgi:4-amino-4-deoxy-L-arabinose transferase-like glycosyltransferase